MQISVASSSLVSIPIIDAILNSSHSLASIISTPDSKSGRGLKLSPNELAAWAEGSDLPVSKPADNSELNRHLLSAQPQLIVTVAYGKIIPVELLHGPRFGWLNLHFSILPRWRGAAPVQWALLSGDEEVGITIFKLDKGVDTGPIFYQEKTLVGELERTPDLLARLSVMGGDAIISVVDSITKATKPTLQPMQGVTLAPKITKEMGAVNWRMPIINILEQDRAIGDKPGIWTLFRGERLLIHSLSLASSPSLFSSDRSKPFLESAGRIFIAEEELLVQCADGFLKIGEVTPAGKKRMKAKDFIRGARLDEQESFTYSA
jgi:methionyl-tRNA formyltransferase